MANRKSLKLSMQEGEPLTLSRFHLGPATALVFENRDGELIDEWLDGDDRADYDHIALMCYWLDEKIIRAPGPVRIAQTYQEYEDGPGKKIEDLVVVRGEATRAEPLAAMISKAVTVASVQHVTIAAKFADANAIELLGQLLIDCPLTSLHLSAQILSTEWVEPPAPSDGPVVEQLEREFWMPSIIRRRIFGASPSPDDIPNLDRKLR